ncbi:hypothetical protein BS78_02G306200 [Paspalum vaginatum]|nr:hypothetical protein BS78_02G306200 [Paspalum vaginatum]
MKMIFAFFDCFCIPHFFVGISCVLPYCWFPLFAFMRGWVEDHDLIMSLYECNLFRLETRLVGFCLDSFFSCINMYGLYVIMKNDMCIMCACNYLIKVYALVLDMV